MEIICKDISQIQDLRVKIHESTLVFPIQKTERRSYFLSNIDQFLNYYDSILQFFSVNPNFPPENVVKRLETALQKVLVPYDFAAGRVRLNNESGRLEIDCNAAGVGFVVASSELSLDEMGDLVYSNPGYKQLVAQKSDNNNNIDDQPICVFQVTSFKCGGFSIGLSGNHMLYDGIGIGMFLENVASQAFENRPLAIIPCCDRHLLAARSPPRVAFPHTEFLKLNSVDGSKISIFSVQEEVLDSKIFTLNSNHINYLKHKAKSNSGTCKLKNTTIFNVVAALVWRCKALSTVTENDNDDRDFTLLYAVEVRSRINPPLPPSYCGNAILNTYASSKCLEIEKRPFPELVEMISDGVNLMTNEYVRSTIDWLEINKGVIVPNGDYLISSWSKLGYEKVMYPWGKPICSCTVGYYRKDKCMLFPNIDGGDEMNVLVTLPPEEMKRFRSLFLDFFGPLYSHNHSKL